MDKENYKSTDWIPFFGYKWYSERNNLDSDESSLVKPNKKAQGFKSDLLFLYNSFAVPLIILGTGFAVWKGLEFLIE